MSYRLDAAAGVALLAAAVAGGHRLRTTMVELELTDVQSQALQAQLGGQPPRHWIVDADHVRVRHYEDWIDAPPVPLGTKAYAVPYLADAPDGGFTLVKLADVPKGTDVFGTGQHASTRMAAQLLGDLLTVDDDVIDVGTGSGLLAVLAVRLGARHVSAFDISEAAIQTAVRTAVLNEVSEKIDFHLGELGRDGLVVDILVANLLAGILLDLMPTLAANLRPDGIMITSGVIDSRVEEVVRAAGAAGFKHSRSTRSDGWTASVFRRC